MPASRSHATIASAPSRLVELKQDRDLSELVHQIDRTKQLHQTVAGVLRDDVLCELVGVLDIPRRLQRAIFEESLRLVARGAYAVGAGEDRRRIGYQLFARVAG